VSWPCDQSNNVLDGTTTMIGSCEALSYVASHTQVWNKKPYG